VHKRIGIFGGTFDPIHSAHLAAADTAIGQLGLDLVYFVPAAVAYHRDSTFATPEQRLHMTQLAIDGDSRFMVSPVDIDRGGNTYSLDTVRELKDQFRHNFPEDTADWFFILGADAFESFGSWRDPDALVSECELVVISRPGSDSSDYPDFPVHQINIPGWEVASTDIRHQLETGKSVQGLLPQPVIDYISDNGLYQPVQS
jgi:nicotinate-nucleotide adenylyltransferase